VEMEQKCRNQIAFRLEVGGDQSVTQGKECPDQENNCIQDDRKQRR